MKGRIGVIVAALSFFCFPCESESQLTYNCSTCITQTGGGGPAHSFQSGFGADYKDVPNPFHTIFKPNYCSQHHGICQYAFASHELIEQAERVAVSGDESLLRSFLLRYASVARYNDRRGALQLVDCANDVIFSAPFMRDSVIARVRVTRGPAAVRSSTVSSGPLSVWIGADAVTSPLRH